MKIFSQMLIVFVAALTVACHSKVGDSSFDSLKEVPLSEDQEVELMRKAREQQIQDEVSSSIFENIGLVNSCKYVSSIGTKAPAGQVVLTFDDGPDQVLTRGVLDVLSKYQIKATFFVTGNHAVSAQNLLKRMVNDGHVVASHSYSHPNFHNLSEFEQQKQILATETQIRGYQGTTKLFRYPFGNSSCESNQFLHERGYGIVGWHVDTCDWAFNQTGTVGDRDARICGVKIQNRDNFVRHVVETVKAHNGGIILMHDIRSRTISQLENIVESLLREGFRFGNLDDERLSYLIK